MGKYSDIRRGRELNEALTKLRAWEDLSKDAKQTLYKGQRGTSVRVDANRVAGYVESFGLSGRIYLPVKLLSSTQTANASLISTVRNAADDTGRTLAANFTLPTGGTKLDGLTGYKPAKISLTQRGAAVSDNKSRITNIEYKRYDNKSVASPFGSKNTGGETYLDAVAAIRAQSAIATFLNDKGNRISFTPEVV
ncbi:hypothetical protein H6G33_04230 [Calothrix sp. FACHB-1219]|uniref:hypothetical protein n=1 Tax=unclassified Calothrix TaxID=2619626 RepID=UPI00168409F7|nr:MULTISPECIES: hypothetical protein [unclassified Calothrix]MBD2204939.1 hypothetical protein [Calothrix sp. FACHB-168]MBD2216236.1 hypothetical protein [Calothrix sp. FACHB-1219]